MIVRDHDFGPFQGAWIMPKDERRQGVVLYLHGGGYTCGNLDYAKGFAATLADECGVRVFCAAYRLAPEDRFPAALDDALVSYQYLLSKGYPANQILLCGESAGGGLIYCLCLRLKQRKLPLPCGLIGISPWTDLTGSGQSYIDNRDIDPSMTPELLQFYAACYTDRAAAVAAVRGRGRGHARRHAGAARKAAGRGLPEQAHRRAGALARVCAVLSQ